MEKTRIDEHEINLKRIVEQWIRNFSKIFIVGLVCAILFTSVMYFKDTRDYEAALNQSNNIGYTLSDNDITTINNYYLLKNKIAYLSDYEKNSVLMSLDPNNTYCGLMMYQVVASEELKYDIARLLMCYINDGKLIDDVNSEWEDAQRYQEVISASLVQVNEREGSGVVRVLVYAGSEEMYQKCADTIKEKVAAYSKTLLNEQQGSVVLKEEHCAKQYSNNVYSAQKNHFDNKNTVNLELQSLADTLSAEQLEYIQRTENGSNDGSNVAIENQRPTFNVIYIIIGFIIGCCVAAIIIAMQVMFGGRIQAEKELARRLQIINIGTIVKGSGGLIDNLITKILYRKTNHSMESQLENLGNKLSLIMKKTNTKEIVLAGTFEGVEKEVGPILDFLNEKNINSVFIKNTTNILDIITNVKDTQKIVLVEKIGVSRINDIYEVANECKEAAIDIMGYISLKE